MDASTCAAYGFQAGTEASAQCQMRLGMERRAAYMSALGGYLNRPAPPPLTVYQPVIPQTRANCTTRATSPTTSETLCQ